MDNPSSDHVMEHYGAMSIKWEWNLDHEDFCPYKANVEGKTLRIRFNPPGPVAYTLLVDGQKAADFNKWPSGWVQPYVHKTEEPTPDSELSIEPRLLREWSEQLCRITSAEPEEMAAALELQGSLVDDYHSKVVEPPPSGTRKIVLHKHTVGFSYVEVFIAGNSLTRAALDAHFGEGRELPRVHFDSPRTIAYLVEVLGAPFMCSVFADFKQEPTASAPTTRVVLRRDPARSDL